jgi:hypothetical protein
MKSPRNVFKAASYPITKIQGPLIEPNHRVEAWTDTRSIIICKRPFYPSRDWVRPSSPAVGLLQTPPVALSGTPRSRPTLSDGA